MRDVAEGRTGDVYYLQKFRRLAMDKLCSELNGKLVGTMMSKNSPAHAVAGFDQDYVKAGRGEVACRSQSGSACAYY